MFISRHQPRARNLHNDLALRDKVKKYPEQYPDDVLENPKEV